MAKAGDEIVNPRTGQRMVFLETGQETGGPKERHLTTVRHRGS
jgi:hypothetical protein